MRGAGNWDHQSGAAAAFQNVQYKEKHSSIKIDGITKVIFDPELLELRVFPNTREEFN